MGKKYEVFVGTVTEPIYHLDGSIEAGRGKGIHWLGLDPDTGELTENSVTEGELNPTHMVLDATGRYLYCVNELWEEEWEKSGKVSAFRVEPTAHRLSLLNRQAAGSSGPNYITTDRNNTHVLAGNFVGGSVAVFPIQPDGRLGERCQLIQHEGAGANPIRQESAHPHSVVLDNRDRFAVVPDLGVDRLVVYRTDWDNGRLTPVEGSCTGVEPGAGPRHGVFHPSGRYFYTTLELNATVAVHAYNEEDGSLSLLQTIPTSVADGSDAANTRTDVYINADGQYCVSNPEDGTFTIANTSADVCVTRDGRFVYASNRGHGTIACYSVAMETGCLSYLGMENAGGKKPRGLAVDPAGSFLLAANSDTDNITVFRIDEENGSLKKKGQIKVPMAASIKIYPSLS